MNDAVRKLTTSYVAPVHRFDSDELPSDYGLSLVQDHKLYARKRGERNEGGVSLIELIVFIVVIGISIVGILSVMNFITRHSADTLISKQAAVIAESLLEEIEQHDMIAASGTAATTVTATNRTSAYHLVNNYNGFSTSGGIKDISGTTIVLGNYNFSPAVGVAAISAGELGASIPSASAVKITVNVTDPTGNVTSISGYRTSY